MKITLVGAGAIGCLFAARLARAGYPVSVLARGETLARLASDGIRLRDNAGEYLAPVHAIADPDELSEQDLVIIAVKQPALGALAERLAPLIGPRTRVLLAMNGVPWWFFDGLGGPLSGAVLESVDPGGRMRDLIPSAQVIGCVVHLACSTPEPAVCQLKLGNRLILGEAQGKPGPALRDLTEVLRQSGFDVELSDCIQRDIWYKLWGNMTQNPISALTGATCDRILDDPLVNAFCEAVMIEAAEIGARIGCPVEQSPAERNAVTRELGAFKTSMLQDVEHNRQLELAALLGAVHEVAERIGYPAPNTAALLGLTRLFAQVRGLL